MEIHQLGLPHYSPRPRAQSPRGLASNASASPQFSSLGAQTARVLEPMFRATQEYIWELMLLDVVAIWIPRIGNALSRGSFQVPLSSIVMDPKYQEKSSLSQFGTWMQKNIKGLNWPNGIEETWREIQSAPMLLLVQSLFFGIAMEKDPVKRGVLMAKNDLLPLNQALASYMSGTKGAAAEALLKQKGGVHNLTTQFYTDLLKSHFKELGHQAVDTSMLNQNRSFAQLSWLDSVRLNRGKGFPVTETQAAMNWLTETFSKVPPAQVTYHRMAEEWVKQLTGEAAKTGAHKNFPKLQAVLNELTKNYNEQILRHHPQLPVNAIRLGMPANGQKTAAEVVDMFEKFYDYMRGAGNLSRKMSRRSPQPLTQLLLKSVDQLEKSLMGRKVWYGFAVTGLTMIAYFASSMHAQSNNAYPANRLYHHDAFSLPQGAEKHENRLSEILTNKKESPHGHVK